ncbi:hypothetical protein H8A97_37945 [Bradyrhizobium sp. Arg62]|uniref:hypothetical protein n=1 Tax=Bradyrhizobium brasilense TaxID=1419277 RepID=UPI001E2CBD92|nr:hypothetical protein [Bradyrhizobium brasilense]MCC8950694.1 hypothetical protein [Bradyrhizobium brasilense]
MPSAPQIKLSKSAPTTPRTKSGRFVKGAPKPASAGRAKGKRNRTTVLLKEAILEAATLVGQDGRGKDGLIGYLKMLAVKERAVYARLLERVLPMQLHVEDKTAPILTPAEAVQRLRERRLPVPPPLLRLAEGTTHPAADDYEDELNGVGYEEDPDDNTQ